MGWGKADEVLALIRAEFHGRLKGPAYDEFDQRQQDALGLTPAQRANLVALLADLDGGTATTLQHQRATARIIRSLLREE